MHEHAGRSGDGSMRPDSPSADASFLPLSLSATAELLADEGGVREWVQGLQRELSAWRYLFVYEIKSGIKCGVHACMKAIEGAASVTAP
jgi:hypothetical protein